MWKQIHQGLIQSILSIFFPMHPARSKEVEQNQEKGMVKLKFLRRKITNSPSRWKVMNKARPIFDKMILI